MVAKAPGTNSIDDLGDSRTSSSKNNYYGDNNNMSTPSDTATPPFVQNGVDRNANFYGGGIIGKENTGNSLVGNDNTSNTGTSSDAGKSITQNQTPEPLNEPTTTLPAKPEPLNEPNTVQPLNEPTTPTGPTSTTPTLAQPLTEPTGPQPLNQPATAQPLDELNKTSKTTSRYQK